MNRDGGQVRFFSLPPVTRPIFARFRRDSLGYQPPGDVQHVKATLPREEGDVTEFMDHRVVHPIHRTDRRMRP
jgi:hypothetical protein